MPLRTGPEKQPCKVCGGIFMREELSNKRNCRLCAQAIYNECMDQMKAMSGPHYQRVLRAQWISHWGSIPVWTPRKQSFLGYPLVRKVENNGIHVS